MAYALDNRGGGQALPPFLQGRSPAAAGSQFQTAPMITPKSTIRPGEVKSPGGLFGNILSKLRKPPTRAPGGGAWGPGGPQPLPKANAAPKITPANAAAAPAANQPPSGQTLYEFFKHDLENQRDAALANAKTDASARGVYYGTPLTTSQGDIQTEFQRGLGQLAAGQLQNKEQNDISRLGLATQLLGGAGQAQAPGVSPEVFQTIGSLLTPRAGPAAAPALTPPKNPLPAQYNPNAPGFRR